MKNKGTTPRVSCSTRGKKKKILKKKKGPYHEGVAGRKEKRGEKDYQKKKDGAVTHSGTQVGAIGSPCKPPTRDKRKSPERRRTGNKDEKTA